MNELLRVSAALALLLAGVWLMVHALQCGPRHWRRDSPSRAWTYLFTFRKFVVGMALVAGAFGLLTNVLWVVGLAALIGTGEWLESSYYLNVMRWGEGQHYLRRGLNSTSD
jgi:hypothetical protein